jgi:hypothetical protein
MSSKTLCAAIVGSVILMTNTGCFWIAHYGPNLGPFGIPIPVSPYHQKTQEDKYWMKERYDRMPILGPLVPGGPEQGLDTPSDDEVMRALEKAEPTQGGVPLLYETNRVNVKITKDKIHDYIDPPRVLPLVGPVQAHHVGYKCTVYYTNVTRVGWPWPHTLVDEDAQQVVYIDHDHLHMVGNVDTGPSGTY